MKALNLLLSDDDDSSAASGQAFSITDGRPVSLAAFLDPLHRALTGGRPVRPLLRLPPRVVVSFARLFQFSAGLLFAGRRRKTPWMPFWGLTPMEAYKV